MGDEVEYLRTQAEIGAAMAALGQWAEAHRKLDDATASHAMMYSSEWYGSVNGNTLAEYFKP